MKIKENIKTLKELVKKLDNHPCCLSYSWDNLNRLTIIFPEGYYFGLAQGLRVNEKSKKESIKLAIEKLEEVWKLNYL